MIDVVLTYPTPEGSREISLDEYGRISFGRGSDADVRVDDDGLSRLHATVHREGERIWVLDENSTNGTKVNGDFVAPSGQPLYNGDSIQIGHYTNIRVIVRQREPEKSNVAAVGSIPSPAVSSNSINSKNITSATVSKSQLIPIAVTFFALLVISISALVIGLKVFGGGSSEKTIVEANAENTPDDGLGEDEPTPKPSSTKESTAVTSPTPKIEASDSPAVSSSDTPANIPIKLSTGKKYQQMSEDEKDSYIREKAEEIARLIGNRDSEAISPAALAKIKGFLNGYVGRLRSARVDDCSGKGWLKSDMLSVLERANKNAPFVNRAFVGQGMDARIGLYLAMIESEHCPCLQSGTGPLGMFQFTRDTARRFFDPNTGIISGASPSNPDDRCKPEPAAKASAAYMKFLTVWFGTGPLSVPLAIGSYNSGEGAGAKNLKEAMSKDASQQRSFWTLIANADSLGTQFQLENFKYVPKFFAAGIIGENPQDFGISLPPLSSR